MDAERKVNWIWKVRLHEHIDKDFIIGKYAWNERHKFGGEVLDVSDRAITLDCGYYETITGDSVYDSIVINGFEIYDYENN